MTPRGVVFLDRDGTLVESDVRDGRPYAVGDPERVRLLDGVVDGCARLRAAGYALVLVTNQPDVARGRLDRAVAESVHQRLVDELGLDLALACYHDDGDGCACRKPLPGMLHEGAQRLGVALDAASVLVGDRWRDVDAGVAAGVTTVFIDHGYDEPLHAPADHVVADFAAAVDRIMHTRGDSRS